MTGAGAATSVLPDGLTLALILTAISLIAHEPWRWIGLFLGRDIDVASEIFRWVRAVATALVSALVFRLVLFPAGALGGVALSVRAGAMLLGVAAFLFAGRRISIGVGVAAAALVLGQRFAG